MKKLVYVSFILLFIIVCSCVDTLTESPDSLYDLKNYFTNSDKANRAVLGVYDVFAKTQHYGHSEMAAQAADDIHYLRDGASNDNSVRDISHYKFSTSNTTVEQLWQYKYMGIERANFALAGIRQMDLFKGGDQTLIKYEGELLFIRALLAFDLVKMWGDVPFKTSPTSLISEAYNPRVPRETIYQQIETDLDSAIVRLPWATASSSPERATKGAAHGLMMRVQLTRAGYSLKMDGTITRPDESLRQIYLNKAKSSWEAIRDNGYHGFYDKGYIQLFKDFSGQVLNSKESLFELAFQPLSMGSYYEDTGYWGVFNGPTVDLGSKWGRANSFFRVIPEWKNFYATGDVRRDVNICTYKIDKSNNLVSVGTTEFSPGKWRREWTTSTYVDINGSSINFCLIRYSDVVLMAAEVYNELGNSSDAITLINTVRKRAGAEEIKSDLANYTSLFKSPKVWDLDFIDDSAIDGKVRTILYWERGFELCYELLRKNDLIRWGYLSKAIQMTGLKSSVKTYYYAKDYFKTGMHELLCIPLNELQINSALENKNNPNY